MAQIPGKLKYGDDWRGGVFRAVNGIIDYLEATRIVGDNSTVMVDHGTRGITLHAARVQPPPASVPFDPEGNFQVESARLSDGTLRLRFRNKVQYLRITAIDWDEQDLRTSIWTLDANPVTISGSIGSTAVPVGFRATVDDDGRFTGVDWQVYNWERGEDFIIIGTARNTEWGVIWEARDVGVPVVFCQTMPSSQSSSSQSSEASSDSSSSRSSSSDSSGESSAFSSSSGSSDSSRSSASSGQPPVPSSASSGQSESSGGSGQSSGEPSESSGGSGQSSGEPSESSGGSGQSSGSSGSSSSSSSSSGGEWVNPEEFDILVTYDASVVYYSELVGGTQFSGTLEWNGGNWLKNNVSVLDKSTSETTPHVVYLSPASAYWALAVSDVSSNLLDQFAVPVETRTVGGVTYYRVPDDIQWDDQGTPRRAVDVTFTAVPRSSSGSSN